MLVMVDMSGRVDTDSLKLPTKESSASSVQSMTCFGNVLFVGTLSTGYPDQNGVF